MKKIHKPIRYDSLDLIRGNAIVLMFIYHFCFGLVQIKVIDARFSSDYFWIGFRTLIIFLFLSLVGIGLYLSKNSNAFASRFIKRMLLLTAYAGLISLISYLVRPDYYVYFGILHHIFIASFLGLLFLSLYRLNLILGVVFIFCGLFVEHQVFNGTLLHWIGLGTTRVISDDFAPLFPWFGFVLFGLFLAQAVFQNNQLNRFKIQFIEQWQPNSWFSKLLCWSGRYSLHLYFAHFIGFYVIVYFIRSIQA